MRLELLASLVTKDGVSISGLLAKTVMNSDGSYSITGIQKLLCANHVQIVDGLQEEKHLAIQHGRGEEIKQVVGI